MKPFLTEEDDYFCDDCGKNQKLGAKLFGCKECQVEICEICYEKKTQLEPNLKKKKGENVKLLVQQSMDQYVKSKGKN